MLTLAVRVKFLKRFVTVLFILVLIMLTALFILRSRTEKERSAALYAPANEDRISFIGRQGLLAEAQAEEKSIIIPAAFNDFYNSYNDIQKAQGFNLAQYQGKEAMMYLYPIRNYENGASDVFAALIMIDGKIIGADLRRNSPDGFLLPLITTGKD